MKPYFFFDFIIFKIFLFHNFFTYFSIIGTGKGTEGEIGSCKIDDAKNSCLNNIMIFENTNGDIYLSENDPIIIFGTTFSNNYQRAFYAISFTPNKFIIEKDDDIYVPFFIKNINQSQNKEIHNGNLCILKKNNNYIIYLFGTGDFYIELLKINQYENDFTLVSPNDLLKDENKVIKGITSLFYIINNQFLIYGTVTMNRNNTSDYFISLYGYKSPYGESGNMLNFKYENKSKIEYDDIKGEYLSCFIFNYCISCFYLSKDNNYTIILAQIYLNAYNDILKFYNKEKIIVGSPSDPDDNNFYFIKAIFLGMKNCIYMYYSGDSNDVPTFLFKEIDETNFILNDTYSNFPIIYLNEKYEFNNDIKYNDISFSNHNQIYFVSTSKNKETIIIAYLYFYSTSNEEEKNNLVIRYYTLELKKYYNMKVFHGLKTAILNPSNEKYLSLGFDFNYLDNSSNGDEMISNAGFILFSYPNISFPKEFDFIEYAFNNNKNYIILDLMENVKIENNIFGYKISSILAGYDDFIKGVKYFLVKSGKILDEYYIYQNDSLVKIVIEAINKNVLSFDYSLIIKPSDDINEINEYCDEINDVYGDKNDNNSYSFKYKNSVTNSYEFYINQNLETICNDTNCILCLRNDINYCIVCKGNYTFIIGDEYMYKKKKICEEVPDEINNTDNFSHDNIILNDTKIDELTNSKQFNSDILTYNKEIANDIKTDKLSNDKYLLTDYESSNTNLKKTNEMANKIETDSNNNENEMLTDSNTVNTEANTFKTEELYNKKNYSDIFKDELTNIKEVKSEVITNEISNENNMINDSVNSLSYNFYSDEQSYEFNINDELSENKKITDMNSFEASTDIYKEKISNTIEISINSDTSENVILSDYDSTSNKNIINTEKLSYLNNISSDNFLTNKYNILITDILTNNNKISIEELINGKFKDINLSNEQLKKIYEDIKKYIIEKYNGNNTIINTNNVKIQISSMDAQKYSEELSNIDLGECGEILKDKYCKKENDSLIMLKFDIKQENETSTYVQYEIYEPLSKIFLELDECSKNKISIDVPIELDPEIEGLYKWLLESGYNLFDPNDTFYNDICAAYTTQNNTDILLYDRRMDIYQLTVNISLCQKGCDFESYNTLTKKAKCDCFIQENQINTDMSDLKFDRNEMIEQFYETIENSNFRVLKCYKLVFNFSLFKKNIGCIFMTILIFLFEILLILHLIIGSKKVNEFIQIIIKNKYFPKDNNTSKSNLNKQIIKFENKNKYSQKYNNTNNNEIKSKKSLNRKILKENKKSPIKKSRRKSVTYENILQLGKIRNITKKQTYLNIRTKMKMKGAPPKRRNSIKERHKKNEEVNLDSQITKLSFKKSSDIPNSQDNMINLNEKNKSKLFIERKEKNKKSKKKELYIYKEYNDDKELKSISKRRRSTMIFSPKKQIHKICKEKDLENYKNNKKKKSSDKKDKLKEEFNKLNTSELNNLEYEKAILLDKRTYLQYYFSLLKKKHLILFTFLPTNDYNVMSLKISLFLVSFSLYLNINAFFFNDDTMHKIYEENGVFNIIAQIPQILYSSIISSIINMILKALSLSEKDILKIKDEKGMVSTVKKSKKIEKCIRIKFVFFFLISLLLMSFFWYFISCFCAVYSNTQAILFKDTLISFTISMLYPIGINLIPGMFRIPSLRAKKKDKKCMYSFSKIIALI